MTLIVVSGAPGTGKSTVSAVVAESLGWPLLAIDPIKEALADVLGLGGEEWSNLIGDAAAEVVFRLAARFPAAVVEGWWRGARRDRAVAEFAGAVEVFCRCDPRLVEARMRSRQRGARHPIHRDMINPEIISRAEVVAAAAAPLGLGAALIEVDTSTSAASATVVAAVKEVIF
jgi:predicted kinase